MVERDGEERGEGTMKILAVFSNHFWAWLNNRQNEKWVIHVWRHHFPPADEELKEVLDRRTDHRADWPHYTLKRGQLGENDLWPLSYDALLLSLATRPLKVELHADWCTYPEHWPNGEEDFYALVAIC
jgi:hypothetical protein